MMQRPKKKELEDNIKITQFMVEDCVDCALDYYKASINNTSRIVRILESNTINMDLLNKSQHIHNSESTFSPFQLYNNGRYTYIVLPYAYMNMESAFFLQQKFQEETLQAIAKTLLESAKILHENGIIHQMIMYNNLFMTSAKNWLIGLENVLVPSSKLDILKLHLDIQCISPSYYQGEPDYKMDAYMIGSTLYKIIIGGKINTPPLPIFLADNKSTFLTEIKSFISENLYEFLKMLLGPEPMNIDDALNHRFMKEPARKIDAFPINNIKDRTEGTNRIIHQIVSTILKEPFMIESMFKSNWELDDDVLMSLLVSINAGNYSERLEYIKYSVISNIKTVKEESLWREYASSVKKPISILEELEIRIPRSIASKDEIKYNFITEAFSFEEYIELRRHHDSNAS